MKKILLTLGLLCTVLPTQTAPYHSPDGDYLRVSFYQDNWFLFVSIEPVFVTPNWQQSPKAGADYSDGIHVLGGAEFLGYLPDMPIIPQQAFYCLGEHIIGMRWNDGDTLIEVEAMPYTVTAPTGPRPTDTPEDGWEFVFNRNLATVLTPPAQSLSLLSAPAQVPDGGSTAAMFLVGLSLLALSNNRRA